jgi:hypothetical protein
MMPAYDLKRAALLRSLLEDPRDRRLVNAGDPVIPRQQEAPTMSRPSSSLARRIIELACRAPSFHNTQPWRWRIVGDETVELYADRGRQLRVADPDGRNLAISCGSALHHAEVAARALGLTPEVSLAPAEAGDLLATIELSPGHTTPAALEELEALERRGTDRRRFTSWPVPEGRLTHLAEAASGWGAYVVPITDVTGRFHTERLLTLAMVTQTADQAYVEEQRGWVEHGSVDGVPAPNAAPASPGRAPSRPHRYASDAETASPATGTAIESTDSVLAICTAGDHQTEWLHAGQALSALWLRAIRDGLSVVPLSQVIEVEETRHALHQEVFAGMARPQILVRIGWQEISRSPLPPTPRRPVDDVIIP